MDELADAGFIQSWEGGKTTLEMGSKFMWIYNDVIEVLNPKNICIILETIS